VDLSAIFLGLQCFGVRTGTQGGIKCVEGGRYIEIDR
jgi:hypothetical protein